MRRTIPALAAIALISTTLLSCGSPQATAFSFPEAVAGWKLKQAGDLPSANVPEQATRLGLKRARVGEYEGTGRLEAEVYELASSAAALEMEQTWKPAADTVAFHREAYFAVVRWQGADRAAVSAFVREMEKRLSH